MPRRTCASTSSTRSSTPTQSPPVPHRQKQKEEPSHDPSHVRVVAAGRRGRPGHQVTARHRPLSQDAGDVGDRLMARYAIVPERSQVWIDARSNVHPIHSATSGLEGFVELALGSDGAVDLSTPPSGHLTLAVDRLKSGNRMEDRELQKRIDAQRYPRIEGELGRVSANGSADSYQVDGDITFRGVSRHYEDLLS